MEKRARGFENISPHFYIKNSTHTPYVYHDIYMLLENAKYDQDIEMLNKDIYNLKAETNTLSQKLKTEEQERQNLKFRHMEGMILVIKKKLGSLRQNYF